MWEFKQFPWQVANIDRWYYESQLSVINQVAENNNNS